MNYIGIDNGISGTVGILDDADKVVFFKTPTIKSEHYAKSRDLLTRIDRKKLQKLLEPHLPALALIEAPFTNPGMFQATLSNHRSHAEISGVLEDLGITFETVLPRAWQPAVLGNVSGRELLKEASLKKAKELFPNLVIKTPDADGLTIAVYLKSKCHTNTQPVEKLSTEKTTSQTLKSGSTTRSRKATPKS